MEYLNSMLEELPWLMTVLDLVGVFFFATSGALLASRKGFDLVGSVFLSLLAGLGGGITRDVLLDRGLPASLENPIYLAPPVLVALLVYFKAIHPHRLNLTITFFDAGGLALFTVTGTMIALEHGTNPVATVVIATLGALGGGLLRDIVANEVPALFDPRGVYALPTVVGAIVATWVGLNGALNAVTGFFIALLVFGIRMIAYRYRWRLPGADISMDQDQIDRLRAAAVQAQESARSRGLRARRRRRVQGPADLAAREAEAPAGYHYDADQDAYTRELPIIAAPDASAPSPVPDEARDSADVDEATPSAAAESGDQHGHDAGRYGDADAVTDVPWEGVPAGHVDGEGYAEDDQVYVEDYNPQTQVITVVDRDSGQRARLDTATGVMDVTDPRTGWTRSYDDPETDW
ncbi:MAG: TRIC cation channel family protein, partial [Micrococcus sp.]|nr:TRIC cation channel family protein [Micrococcus sp.]